MKIIVRTMTKNPETGEPECKGKKLLYAAADFGETLSEWAEKSMTKIQKVDGLAQSSGLRFRPLESKRMQKKALVYTVNKANDVQHNAQDVAIMAVPFSDKGTKMVVGFPDNFMRAMALYAARRCIARDWTNSQDEYVAPSSIVEASEEFEIFAMDALVYALFEPKNNCTAVRGIPFKGNTVDVANQMFWRTPDEMRKLADAHMYHEMYIDLRGVTTVPHVASILQKRPKMSKEAERVLKYADIFLEMSMKDRAAYSTANPDYHLDSWDAGYYQLKYLWRESRHYEKFRELFKALEESLIPRVYSLGFLRTYECMGLQMHDVTTNAVKLYATVAAGGIGEKKEHSPSGKTLPSECDKCSVCGGKGCDFCGYLGSREYYLDKVFWDTFYALREAEYAEDGVNRCENPKEDL